MYILVNNNETGEYYVIYAMKCNKINDTENRVCVLFSFVIKKS